MTEIEATKILSKWGLKTDAPKQVDDFVGVLSKRLTMNIIKNIIHVKEAVNGKSDNKISTADIKEANELMNRLRFYSQLHINMKGGNRTVLPPSYFNEKIQEPMYGNNIDPDVTALTSANNGIIARPEFQSTQFVSDGNIDFPGPDGVQFGGGMLSKIKRVFMRRKSTKFVQKQSIEEIIEELNNRYKKNPIRLESDKVIHIVRDSVNENLNILFSYYSSKVSSTNLEISKLKKIVEEEPMFQHFSKVPSNT